MNKKILFGAAALLLAATTDLSAQWSLTGNAGTNPSTNFIGTTDSKAFRIRTNNAVRLSINAQGKVGIGTNTPLSKLDILGAAGAGDTVPALNVLVKYAGNVDVVGIHGESTPAAGYGVGVEGVGAYWGTLGIGTYSGVYGYGAGFTDTTVVTGAETHGVVGEAGPAAYSLGVYGIANAGNFNYGVYGENNGVISDTAGSKRWAGYFYGDAFAIRFFQASDNKLKSNVTPLTSALEKLSQIQTATYDFKTKEFPQVPLPSGKQIGFLAENVEAVFPELIKESTAPRIENKNRELVHDAFTFKSVNYTGMIPVVVAAINEQQQIIKQKDLQITEANARITKLENDIAEIKAALASGKTGSISESAFLMQNTPNPSNGLTTIKFYLPENSKGQLLIVDATGKTVKSYKVSGSGMNQVELNTQNLANGSYTYQLILDGKTADSKSMIISK